MGKSHSTTTCGMCFISTCSCLIHYYWLFFRPEDGLEAKISKFGSVSFASISHEELGLFLRSCEFLRFRSVTLNYNDWLNYDDGFQSIGKRCQLFVTHLKPLKTALSDSTKIEFNADIGSGQIQFVGEGQNNFRDPLQLLNHLRNELLPVCDSVRRYEFAIRFFSHGASAIDILYAILRMQPMTFSTNVEFNLYQPRGYLPQFLPVDAIDPISAWLDRSNDMVMKCKQQQKTPLDLKVYLQGVRNVQNAQELFEHFKKVHFANSFIKIIKNHSYLKNNKFSKFQLFRYEDTIQIRFRYDNFKAGGWRG